MGPDLSRARRAARRATRLQAPAPDRLAPVIVALDFAGSVEALALVDALGDACTSYKVGLQLLTEAGPDVVRALVARGKAVFLDLKLHEIPHSVAGAVRAAGKLGAGMVTVHASAGSAVLRAAVAAAAEHPRLQVLALTVITSLTDRDLPEIGLAPSVQQQVERLARLAAGAGCHGIVASAQEAAYLRTQLPPGMAIVTPGIQLPGAGGNDQARVATVDFARRAGATHVVIGRSITQAASPRQAFASAVASMGAVDAALPLGSGPGSSPVGGKPRTGRAGMPPFRSAEVAAKFAAYPSAARQALLDLRALILAVAAATPEVGEIEESLKWGEPAYRARNGAGSTVRIDWKPRAPQQVFVYFHCKTSLVETFRTLFPNDFRFVDNRALVFTLGARLPEDALRLCMGAALTYHAHRRGGPCARQRPRDAA